MNDLAGLVDKDLLDLLDANSHFAEVAEVISTTTNQIVLMPNPGVPSPPIGLVVYGASDGGLGYTNKRVHSGT